MMDRIGRSVAAISPGTLLPLWLRFRESPLSVRLAKGVFWSFLGAAISRGMGVVSSIFVARLLGITAFGEFTVIQSTVGLFGTFAGLGLGITVTKYVAELRETDPVRCGRVIGLILLMGTVGGVAAGIILFWFADWFAANTLAAPHLAPLLRQSSALVLFTTLQGVYTGALGGFEAFKKSTQVNWVGALIGTPLLVLGTYCFGLQGAVCASVLQVVLACVIGHMALLKESGQRGIRVTFDLDRTDFGILWRFSLPAFLSTLLSGPANWICNTLLVNQNEGYKEIALLNAAGTWKNFLSFLPLMMTSVLVPMLANLYREGKSEEFKNLLRRNLWINSGVCLALVMPLVLLSSTILGWYGPEFMRGQAAFVLSLLGTAIVAANNLLSRAMLASGRAWVDLGFSGLWVVVLVVGCVVLIPRYKAAGLALSHIVAAVVLLFWQWCLVRKLFQSSSPIVPGICLPSCK